jgi:hypothetical protein
MIMVTEYGNEPIFLREGMDYLQGFLRAVSAVNKVPEVYHEVNPPK